jgi:hypothetical protein
MTAAQESKHNIGGDGITKSFVVNVKAAGLHCQDSEGEISMVLLTAISGKRETVSKYTKKMQE